MPDHTSLVSATDAETIVSRFESTLAGKYPLLQFDRSEIALLTQVARQGITQRSAAAATE